MGKPKDRDGEHAEFSEQYRHVAERDAATQNEAGFRDAGYDETLPGQHEVEAGSVEHVQLLKSYPNATSYAPDVNVVAKEEAEPPPEPLPEEDELQREEGESDEDYELRRDAARQDAE
jgi:hypothetical protein